jgi:hypothetical protein
MGKPPRKKIKSKKGSLTNFIRINILPREILCIIFSNLDKKSVKSATATCRLWFELIRNDLNLSSYICLKIIKPEQFDQRIQDLETSVAKWPVLKSIKFCGPYHYPFVHSSVVEKIVKHLIRLVNSKDCPNLEKIIVSVSYCLESFFPRLPAIGTIEEFTFNPKEDIKSLQVKHIAKLDLKLFGHYGIEGIDEKSKISSVLKSIGDTACNLKGINITALYKKQELIDCFQDSFCHMLKQLTHSLQRVLLKVKVLDDSKGYLLKLCEQCKNLRKFHVDVFLYKLSDPDDDWIQDEFPKQVEKIFKFFADVQIQFFLEKEYNRSIKRFAIVTKEPCQSKAISTPFSVYRKISINYNLRKKSQFERVFKPPKF